ncbi:MAG TPA: PIN domain-containing protein [Phycisphaerae bacterium]|jgi:predicted nucleic acid-binding protein|nr:PIN domain-containing protein [Phycisphaerae bacterium]
MIAIDTNIWIYSHDTRYPDKQQRAQELIQEASPLTLPWQVGCEFIAASRKLEPFGFSEEDAWAALEDMCNMADAIPMPEPELWPATRLLQQRHGLPFWGALIVAACQRFGVQTLYSEDFGSLRDIDGLAIVNPFVQ